MTSKRQDHGDPEMLHALRTPFASPYSTGGKVLDSSFRGNDTLTDN